MPELPEVESVCRLMRRVLVGKRIARATVPPDDIVLGRTPPEAVVSALEGRTVEGVGRKGKYWWIELGAHPWVYGHLGMSGWIREMDKPTRRLHSHGNAPLDDESGYPRFLKLLIEAEDGTRVAFTDGRRLGRLWLGNEPANEPQIKRLGFDAFEELPTTKDLAKLLAKRKAPMKAVLLDQATFAGVGNYLADEILYHAGIAPKRLGVSLTEPEVDKLRIAVQHVIGHAVSVDADYEKFPEGWLFHHRWGGGRGVEHIGSHSIVRETVGGRTTAWVPEVQR